MATHSHFDYIIIGNGLAGLQLALKFSSDSYFKNKKIALIDPSPKNINDKTWSFWETKPSQWDSIIYKFWDKASVITTKKNIDLKLNPYTYNTVRAIDFYSKIKEKLKQHSNFYFILESVVSIRDKNTIVVNTHHNTFTASHVFDSRMPENYSSNSNTSISITQHFKGIIIETETNTFDDTKITMMDYRLKDGKQTTFTYVLPFTKSKALIEFTYFTKNLVEESVYDTYLKAYIKDFLKIDKYSILETEIGSIPMTSFNFNKYSTKNVTKIGTGGGWVKASTGYSFKHTEKKVSKIVENIKTNRIPSTNLYKSRYRFYDKIFLKVLKDENHKGEWLFEQFYSKNSPQTMFRFLDEESSIYDELKIMLSLFSWTFIKAFFKTL